MFVLRAFQRGADGVILCGCHPGDCHYSTGNYYARRRMTLLFSMLDYLGVERERTRVEWVSAAEGAKFSATMNDFVRTITELGENRRAEGSEMQEMIINRVKELLSEGKGDRVLAWEAGESAYDRTPAVYTAENIDSLKYDSLCGCNLSKYLISESAKDGRVIALIKPCDSYSLNQLLTEHRVNRDKVYVLAVGCRGKIDVEKIRAMGIRGITGIDENGDKLTVHTLYGDHEIQRADALLTKCLSCKGKEHKIADETIGESEETNVGGRFDMVEKLEAMNPEERFEFWRGELSKLHSLQRLPQRLPRVQLRQMRVRQSEFRRSE